MAIRGIDTHAHLFLEAFRGEWEAITHRAREVCQAVLLPNLDTTSLPQLEALVAYAPDFYYGMVGLHPMHVGADYQAQLGLLAQKLESGSWVAIGEVGLDLYHSAHTRTWQEAAFVSQVEWARRYNLPLSIHFRAALNEVLALLKPYIGQVRGVFHCFTGNREEAYRILEGGFVLGLGGVVTFRNATALQEAVRYIPAGSFVLETDSPYLAPHPLRGRRNESSYLSYIAKAIAALRDTSEEAIWEETTQTACALFFSAEVQTGNGRAPSW